MRARAPASPETRPASVTAGVRAGWAARLSRSRDIRGSNACRMLSADGQRRPGAGSVAAITQRDFTRRPGGGEFAQNAESALATDAKFTPVYWHRTARSALRIFTISLVSGT